MTEEWTEGVQHDWASIEQRLAVLLHMLATLCIGEKFKVDPAAAESAIRYCQERKAGEPYNPARQEHFWDFVCRCGGSMDWI
jgi:hypothetical protein